MTNDLAIRNELSTRQRDLLLLTIFVLTQHGYIERAAALAEALHVLGDHSTQVALARAVLRFFAQDWSGTLACLDELDNISPIERFGSYTMNDTQRMRRYLKARCFYELKDYARARDVVESYLRHGSEVHGSEAASEAHGSEAHGSESHGPEGRHGSERHDSEANGAAQ